MADVYISETTIIPLKLRVMAHGYHLHHGDRQANVVRVYRTYRDPRGFGGTEWLLVRFKNKDGKAYSALHMICMDGKEEYLSEYFSCERKEEKTMIESWQAFVKEDDDG